MILVDTNVLLDVLEDDPKWAAWSQAQLESAALTDRLAINAMIYSELSMAFERIEELERVVAEAGLAVEVIPREALFLAGKVFLAYRRRKGSRQRVLPDFFIGAHAAVVRCSILTRDVGRYRGYFPTVPLVTPAA
ncbi:MAG: type II toxin-antitoxin system VapC family toxin [Steroidobacteraceae bacterium]